MKKRVRTLAVALLVLLLSYAPQADAWMPCQTDAFRQDDMQGVYVSSTMLVEIFPCGGTYLEWDNAYGTHVAAYYGVRRLEGGGFLARGFEPDPEMGRYLDDTPVAVFKPAEPGHIQVITVAGDGWLAAYILEKVDG